MTLDQLSCFVSVVEYGGFKAAAKVLHISQPSVSNAVRKLEEELGFSLFSRESYRASLTPRGVAFLQRCRLFLEHAEELRSFGRILAQGEEASLSVAVLESAPFDIILKLLKKFFANFRNTRLKVSCEGVRGAEERLREGDVDIAVTVLSSDPEGLDLIDLGTIELLPVCAASFLPKEKLQERSVTSVFMKNFVQVLIRDTAVRVQEKDFGVVAGAPTCTVSDQVSKKKIICSGLGWGRLPHFLIRQELASGSLIRLNSKDIVPVSLPLKAVRRREDRGPVSEKLWSFLEEMASRELMFT